MCGPGVIGKQPATFGQLSQQPFQAWVKVDPQGSHRAKQGVVLSRGHPIPTHSGAFGNAWRYFWL